MRVALIMENSQAAKNALVFEELNNEAKKAGHTVDNYGQFSAEDPHVLTYVQNGLLAAILLNSKAADFVVTGCGTGEGAMVAANAFPGVVCGHVTSPLDAYLFGQVNDGNAISLPFAQGFGWGGELNLRYTFEKLFSTPFGGGYPIERREPEQRNARILDSVKTVTHRNLVDILAELDNKLGHDFVKSAIDYPEFKELFYKNAQDEKIIAAVEAIIGR